MKENPFFIIGTQRGGTTFLRLMLNEHSELAIPPESHFIIPLLKVFGNNKYLNKNDLDKAISIIINHPRWETWSIGDDAIEDLKNNTTLPIRMSDLIEQLFNLQIFSTGKVKWGDKTPEYINIIPKLIELFPLAKFVVIIRDGRDVSLSLKNRGWHGWSVMQRANYWKCSMLNIEILKQSKNHIIVRYEDLVLYTKRELIKICKFLNVCYEEQMLDFNLSYKENISETEKSIGVHKKLSRKPQTSDIEKWKYNSGKTEIWAFEAFTYKQLLSAGYSLKYYNPKDAVQSIMKVVYVAYGYSISLVNLLFYKLMPSSLKEYIKKTSIYSKVRNAIKSI